MNLKQNNKSKGLEEFRTSKKANQLTESSYKYIIRDLRFSKKLNMET